MPSNSPTSSATLPALASSARSWVESTLNSLSLSEKIAQLFHTTLTHWDQRIPQQKLIDRVVRNRVGGSFMAGRPWRELLKFAAAANEGQIVPIIFSGDSECGPNTPSEGVPFGSAMALGAVADLNEAVSLAYEVGKVAALQCRACGVRWSFAPVADLNLNPDNPITNIRSFGSDPDRVAALVCAYLRGMQEHGLAATLKHFPGDGMDSRDQHVMTAINPLPEKVWRETYGKVFQAGIEAGAWAVMVGHLAWTPRSSRHRDSGQFLPATADSKIQVDLLRQEFGFEGLIVSDAIGMGGLAGHFQSEAEVALANILAGSDVALFVEDIPAATTVFLRAIERGELASGRVDDSVRRILELKARVGLDNHEALLPSEEEAEQIFNERHSFLARQLSEKSVTLLHDRKQAYPLRLPVQSKIMIFDLPRDMSDLGKLAVVDATTASNPPIPSNEAQSREKTVFELELESFGYQVEWAESLSAYDRKVAECDAVIYLFRNGPMAGRNSVRISYNAIQSIDFVRVFSGFPSYFIAFGSPFVAWEIPVLPNLICTYGGHDAAQKAVVAAMAGKIPFAGKLPVEVPEDSGFFPRPLS